MWLVLYVTKAVNHFFKNTFNIFRFTTKYENEAKPQKKQEEFSLLFFLMTNINYFHYFFLYPFKIITQKGTVMSNFLMETCACLSLTNIPWDKCR